jgi:selenocysteine-specific elongation factor
VVDVAVVKLPGEDVNRRGRLHAAVGSGEHRVWFRALDDQDRYARLRFDTGLPLAPGDRLVLRDAGRRRTLAGAEVLDTSPARRVGDVGVRLGRPLGERLLASRVWLDDETLGREGGLSADEARAVADELVAGGVATRVDRWAVDGATLAALRSECVERVLDHHRRHPRAPGVDLSALVDLVRVPAPQLRAALADAPTLVVERGVVRDRSHGQVAESPEARRLLDAFDTAPFAPPDVTDRPEDRELVRALVREGVLVDVDGVVFSADALDQARRAVIDALRERPRLTVADIRDLLGSTRKYVLPICGWLDRNGVTRRRGDERIPGPASRISA